DRKRSTISGPSAPATARSAESESSIRLKVAASGQPAANAAAAGATDSRSAWMRAMRAMACQVAVIGKATQPVRRSCQPRPRPVLWVGMRLIDYFDRGAALDPDRMCLVEGQRRLSYREVQRLSHRIAARLHASGYRPGAKVAVLSPNSALAFCFVLGALRAGCVWVPI